MKIWKIVLAGTVAGWAWSSGALAQTDKPPEPAAPPAPQTLADPVTIKISRQNLLTIGQAIQELPAKIANPLLNDLQAQLNAADKDAAEKAQKTAETERRVKEQVQEALKEKAAEKPTEAPPKKP